MNPTTIELLRNAAIEALQNKQDESAAELLSLMELPSQPQLVATPSNQLLTIEEPKLVIPPLPKTDEPRDYHFWRQAINDCYLPALKQEEKTEFTTPQLFSWIDYVGFPLTAGDLQMSGNRPYWKGRVGAALDRLCDAQVIHRCGFFSRTYSTVKPTKMLEAAQFE